MTPDGHADVLLIDDEPEMVVSLRRALARDGYRFHESSDPRFAAGLLAREDIDVIVSDVDMPGLSGLELMEIARTVRPTAARILVTGAATLESATRAINTGEVHRFLHKPFQPDILREVVAQALARRRELARVALADQRIGQRRRLLDALEREHPGIATFDRDGDAYRIDTRRARELIAALGLFASG